tara:strand:+ start:480 stop:911 length:432 start_codon:yes stop_codon:yes gene_type:complete
MKTRKFLPSLSELIDRLAIHQLKEVFIIEHKQKYAKEIQDIIHDIDIILDENKQIEVDGDMMRNIIVLAQINTHIWYNESAVRAGTGKGNLRLTHGLNGIRTISGNRIMEKIKNGKKDYKIDCLAAEFKDWEISWDGPNDEEN